MPKKAAPKRKKEEVEAKPAKRTTKKAKVEEEDEEEDNEPMVVDSEPKIVKILDKRYIVDVSLFVAHRVVIYIHLREK